MSNNTPVSPRPVRRLSHVHHRVVTARTLRENGVSAAAADERCRPGGPWRMPLPGVYLLHPGPPTGEERLHAVLLYAAGPERPPGPAARAPHPVRGARAVITGPAALALHGFSSTPPLSALEHIDVLVPHTRRLRPAGCARVVRTRSLPASEEVTGLPVAPVPRALADTAARTGDAVSVRRMLTEAVRDGHCEARAIVRELARARLLGRPHLADAVDALLAESRSVAESLLYGLVRAHSLPEPCWNVDLRLPGGLHLGGVDAYWPGQAVAVEIDLRDGLDAWGGAGAESGVRPPVYARKRERLRGRGVTVVHVTAAALRDRPAQQAAVVRTALVTAPERGPVPGVEVLPR
ncbi:hypothetical protein [Streptomyces sp. CNQ085]|uniref:hypothetical protein n=1 Tax=Streptomyces sp. CNQ085 TaxID=2886944 RepID=UPI001F5123AF|nr:hypothetical protein [Streptomyces sp. CNQ085]MCI0383241.1 hypothetical protein [Streptomyces sp. CNQ085]